MCGRYAYVPTLDAWARFGDVLGPEVADALKITGAQYNIAPTDKVPIIVHDRRSGGRRVVEARWGLIPHWWTQARPPTHTMNARIEEAATKPMWRDAWRSQRCLIPATHWYEWRRSQGMKVPHAITSGDGSLGFMFAGLWSHGVSPEGEAIISFTILTTGASESVAHIHDRMPVVLAPSAWNRWLDPALTDPTAVAALVLANIVGVFNSYPTSRRVNSVRNQDPGVLDPDRDLLS
jgi:putative SOS response-associated peptidase YedK